MHSREFFKIAHTLTSDSRAMLIYHLSQLFVIWANTAHILEKQNMATLNASIGPVLDSVILLFPTLLELVIAAIPIIIAMGLIGFVLGLFDGILGKIKM